MAETFQFPTQPPKAVLDFLSRKQLKPSFDYREVWKQENQAAFTVAKATRLDILQDIHEELTKAMASGQTLASFQKQLKPLLQKKGWWGIKEMTDPLTGKAKLVQLGSPRRLKIIYDTNMRTAYAHGQWQRIQRTKAALPYLTYEIGPSKNHRKDHVQWQGLCLPADDPFWDSHYPPNGWGCKCRVRQVSQYEYDQLNKAGKIGTKAPPIKRQEYINKRTGVVEQVPEGIDPGWDYNPGKMRFNEQLNQLTGKLNRLEPELARAAVKDLVKGPAFAAWYAAPEGAFPLAVLPHYDQARLGAQVKTAVLSPQTLAKQRQHHPELAMAQYSWVQRCVDEGKAILDKGSLIYILEKDGFVSVIKATKTGKALFVTSVRRLSSKKAWHDQELRRLMGKGEEK